MRVLSSGIVMSIAAILAACTPAPAETPSPAQLNETPPQRLTLINGGTIYTGNPDVPIADSVVFNEAGRIVALNWDPALYEGDGVIGQHYDLFGQTLFPGFVDSHAHLLGIGQRENTLNLQGTPSLAAMLATLEIEIANTPEGRVIFGRGWIENDWPEGRMPTAADLDAIAPAHPLILLRADGHALVANTAAILAAGVTQETPDPEGGQIERGADGAATGLFIDTAMTMILALAATPDEAAIREALQTGAEVYASRGWTGMHSMSVAPEHAPILAELDTANLLPLRLHNCYTSEGFTIAASRTYETPSIQNRCVKLVIDGALGSRGANLIAPYSDRPESTGLSRMDDDELAFFMMHADNTTVQLAIHAIGDLANRRILDTFSATGYGAEKRWRIEHAQILAPEDLPRLAELGLIASMQPSHAIGDLSFAPARLGMARLQGAYAWQSLLDSGAIISGGTDAPVEIGSPVIEFYAAITRRNLAGDSGEGWHPEQAVSRADALAFFTRNAAYASFQEDDLGTIEVGKLADFTVFDKDLMQIEASEILTTRATMTFIGGELVWESKE